METPKAPVYQPPPPDPAFVALQQQSQQQQITAAQQTVQLDTASLMARYGTRLALANVAGGAGAPSSPLIPMAAAALGARA